MPQILVDGQLVEISQAEYDALGQGSEATTTATAASDYEQYALLQAKIDGVKQLAAADSAVTDSTTISPEYQAELDRLQIEADAVAGGNLAQYRAQYQTDRVDLQAQGAANYDALRQELLEDPQPAIVEPGAVPAAADTLYVSGEEIVTVNTTDNEPGQTPTITSESAVAQPDSVNTSFTVSTPAGTLLFPDEQTYQAYQEGEPIAVTQVPGGTLVTQVDPPPESQQTIDPTDDPEVPQETQPEVVPLSEIDTDPTQVSADDPQVSQETQPEVVPLSEIDTDPTQVSADDPQVPEPDQELFTGGLVEQPADIEVQAGEDLAEPIAYDFTSASDADPVVVAADTSVRTDIALADIDAAPDPVDTDFNPQAAQPEPPAAEGGFFGEPTPVGGNYTSSYNPETGTYDVVDLDTGQTVESGLSQQQASLAAQDLSLGDPQFPNETEQLTAESDIVREPTAQDVAETFAQQQPDDLFVLNEETQPQPDEFGFVETEGGLFVQQDEIEAQIDQEQFEDELGAQELSAADIVTEPENISLDEQYQDEDPNTITDLNTGEQVDPSTIATTTQAGTVNARQQAEFQQQRKEANDGDWRVRLRLAPGADYLYKDASPGILDPLVKTDGVIFPYTPTITTAYKANYNSYDLTHSNYRGYFYQGSYVDDIQINAQFTAQDSVEANYLLAVIHFFRSATKMFYGQDDSKAGAPPPLVYLQGHGMYQFNLAPCVIAQFNYNLPADVDYIRAQSPNINGTNLLQRRSRQSAPTNPFSSAVSRITNLLKPQGIRTGAQQYPPAAPTLGQNSPTYVPTKMEISIILHPIQSRDQVSKQFSLKNFANGNLIKGGFW